MFSWKPIYEEIALRVLSYENRQTELIDLLETMAEAGLNVIFVTDHLLQGTKGRLEEIDPFTFFSSFNRGTTTQKRLEVLRYLKKEWNLKKPLPHDFNGIPIVNPQAAWFFPYAKERPDTAVPNLWKLAHFTIEDRWDQCGSDLFQQCLQIKGIGIAKLTTGLFWLAPSRFLPIPTSTQSYLKSNGISEIPKDKSSYDQLLKTVTSTLSGDFLSESHRAWVHCYEQKASNFDFNEATRNQILEAIKTDIPDFSDFTNPGKELQDNELDYKNQGLEKFQSLGGRAELSRLLANNQAAEALGLIKKSTSLNIASFQSWRPSFGEDNPEALHNVLEACLAATESPYSGYDSLLSIFDAIDIHGLKPAWDTLSVVLWSLNPEDYFPIKISYYRNLANAIGYPLPKGRPTVESFDEVLRFGKAIWKTIERFNPTNWIEVQSIIWVLSRGILVKKESSTQKKIWTFAPGREAEHWDYLFEQGIIAIGWNFLEDLGNYSSKVEIEQTIADHRESDARPTNDALACWSFLSEMNKGDIVLVKSGRTKILGIGRITSDYIHDTDQPDYHHVRKVDWIKRGEWSSNDKFALKTLTDATPYPDFCKRLLRDMGLDNVAIELFGQAAETESTSSDFEEMTVAEDPNIRSFDRVRAIENLFMSEQTFDTMLAQFRRKKNLILQGPPGVGKTFVARTIAYALMDEEDDDRIEMVQFHQSYGYEEFIQGLRPTSNGSYTLRSGVFHLFCEKALDDPDREYVFVIDEINRGNLSKILGELMMLIERDKRHKRYAMPLAYSDPGSEKFFVPPNVHILGLMNTADRSLAMVDYALRRRFAFYSLVPEFSSHKFRSHLLNAGMPEKLLAALITSLETLNTEIRENHMDLGAGFCIGHSFFCCNGEKPNKEWINDILDFEIRPLLQEYWMESPEQADVLIDNIKIQLA